MKFLTVFQLRNGGVENLDPSIVKLIKGCLDKHNSIVKHYRSATEILKHNVVHDVNIRLIRNGNSSGLGRQYNMSTASELAALIYPLFLHYGDNGYDSSMEHGQESLLKTKKKTRLTPREYLAFRLMRRNSERYMIQKYQDAMAICAWVGYPDIFITFTCNPMWPEIIRHCNEDGLKPCDRPEVLSRIFYIKLHKLMHIMKDKKIFGTIKAEVYTIEFQKRGLPHAHIILWLSETDKTLVSYMIRGPCGRSSASAPCMKDGRCSKYFPRKFNEHTMLDENGYPTYRRRNDNRTVTRKGIEFDNRFVVPYNCRLLKLFHGHLNVEKTNQSRAIKYLFKYISKGHDRVIAGIYDVNDGAGSLQGFDKISHYLNCKYISSCEASWRIFVLDIHHRQPPVERLSFHLRHQRSVYYTQTDTMSSLLNNPRVKGSMFLAWMGKEDMETLSTWVFSWEVRSLYTISGRIILPPFTVDKDDDNEFIDAIKEASLWASGNYLRKFFTSMLLSYSLSQPAVVWEQTKDIICEDLLQISHVDPQCTDVQITNAHKEATGLYQIEQMLLQNGKSLRDYPSMPTPEEDNIIDIERLGYHPRGGGELGV
ncbi:hypothetical protein K1719_020414 [Acacia pycnantha]|nr:hypothetical protein K1719_020414 [Acacia pycnantha]